MSMIDAKTPGADATSEANAALQRGDQIRFHKRLQVLAATIIVLVGMTYLLREFATVFQQLLVALFLSYMIMPVHGWLMRRRVPSRVASALIIAAVAAAFAGLGILVGNSFNDLATKLPQYQSSLDAMIEDTAARFPRLGRYLESRSGPNLDSGVRFMQSALLGLSDFLSQAFLVVVYLLFILFEQVGFAGRLQRSFPPEVVRQVRGVGSAINASITQYIVVKTVMGLLAGAITVAVAWFFGVDYAVLWGILAFLFNYIPYLGSILATAAPVLLSLVQFQDVWTTLWILSVLVVAQIAIGYLIEPRLAGRKLDLSPLVIIVALAFWGSLWGIVGMVLAVPLLVAIRAILENTAATRPLARMLGNA